MSDSQDLEERAASLRTEIKDTRARRIAAQKSAAAEATLRKALGQAERDRSSSTTEHIENLKDEIQSTRLQLIDKTHLVDLKRFQFITLDETYPSNSRREDLIETMNAEAQWRAEHNSTDAAKEYDLVLPSGKELS